MLLELLASLGEAPTFPFGNCLDVDPDIFYSENPLGIERAKELCFSCPHKQECLAYALEADLQYGVQGGYSASERKEMRENGSQA